MAKKNNIVKKVMADVSLHAAKKSVNSVCPAFFYQPEIPETVKKFKKY